MKDKRINDSQLAKALDCSPSTVYQWRLGKFYPRSDTLPKICEALDCSADELLGIETKSTPNLNRALSKELYKALTKNGAYNADLIHGMATVWRRTRGNKLTEFEQWLRSIAEAVYKVEVTTKQKPVQYPQSHQLNLFELS